MSACQNPSCPNDSAARENERLRRWLAAPIEQRLVEHLALIAERHEGELRVLRPHQPSIAKAIGTCRETVSRTMARMHRDGLLEYRRYGGKGHTPVLVVLTQALLERTGQVAA